MSKGRKLSILLVGGTFNTNRGKASGVVSKINKSLMENDISQLTTYNGGNYSELQEISKSVCKFDIVIWLANVTNDLEKVSDIKGLAPYTLLISSERNDKHRYTFQEILNHSLEMKSNLVIEFSKVSFKTFNMMVFDTLGNCWYNGKDIESMCNVLIERITYLKSVTRQRTIKAKENTEIAYRLLESYKELDMDELNRFIKITQKHVDSFHKLLVHKEGMTKVLGSRGVREGLRYLKGFPSFRSKEFVFISKKSINKSMIGMGGFVPTYIRHGEIYYYGGVKPSIDATIQLRLYEKLPNINYMLHLHCYVEGAVFTDRVVTDGVVENAQEVLDIIKKRLKGYSRTSYILNLKGNGSIIMGNTPEDLENITYKLRALPEKI